MPLTMPLPGKITYILPGGLSDDHVQNHRHSNQSQVQPTNVTSIRASRLTSSHTPSLSQICQMMRSWACRAPIVLQAAMTATGGRRGST